MSPRARRFLAGVLSLLASLAAAEVALRLLGLPNFPAARRNELTGGLDFQPAKLLPGYPMHRIKPGSRYTTIFASDPRGYFGPTCGVSIFANERGHRGPACIGAPSSKSLRIAFLGDSFTLGEGVKDEDVYAALATELLKSGGALEGTQVESCNFGMLAFNTTQEWILLEEQVLACEPDVVVLGYFLNDAAPPFFTIDWTTGSVQEETRDPALFALRGPPDGLLYRSRLARAVWKFLDARERRRLTVAYYSDLYTEQNPAWARNRESLQAIVLTCRKREIPLIVLCFPVLDDLEDYAFLPIHEVVRRSVAEVAGPTTRFMDLLPHFRGWRAEELQVHPTDHHPNEVAHRIAAEVLAQSIASEPAFHSRRR